MKQPSFETRGSSIPMMAILGTALVVAGAFLVFGGGSFASHRETMRVEGVSMWTEEPRPIKPWLGGAALVAGLGLVYTTLRRRSGSR